MTPAETRLHASELYRRREVAYQVAHQEAILRALFYLGIVDAPSWIQGVVHE